jgi:HK97 family phage major capsid protein
MNLAQLKARRAAEFQAAEALAANETLTPEQQTQLDAHLAKVDELDAAIKSAEKLAALKPAAPVPGPNSPGLEEQRENPGAQVHDRAEDRPFASFGDFLLAVHAAGQPGANMSDVDPRLKKHDLRRKEVRAASGMNETVNTEGGFMVQQDVSTTLLERATFQSQVWSRTSRQPIGQNSNGLKLPYVDESSRATGSRWGGVRAYWLDEAQEKLPSKPTLGRLEMTLKKLAGLCYVTDELLEDAVALESFIDRAFTEEFAFVLDDAVIRGTGVGQPLGILNSPARVTVAKEAGQVASTINATNIIKMWARLSPRSRAQSVWLGNADIAVQIMNLQDANGNPLYMPPGGLSEAPFARLMGRPVVDIEHAESLGTEGDLMLVDLSQYIRIERDMQRASSMHVRFIYDETVFRFVQRVDGQPAWRTPVTPYKGTVTRSPFVTLATRA